MGLRGSSLSALGRRVFAASPGISGPSSEVRFARLWNGVEAPQTLSGLRIIGVQESVDTVLAASHSDKDSNLRVSKRSCNGSGFGWF